MKEYNSQALEADALHSETDVWSSAVVIAGLVCVKLGEWAPSLGVSVLAIWVCWQLGRRTVDALVDSAPAGMEERILAAVSAVPGVRDCHNIRVRYSGPILFLDLHVLMDGSQTLFQAHALTETIEGVIQQIVPHADVTVHPEPE